MKKLIFIIFSFLLISPFAFAYDTSQWSIEEKEYNRATNSVEIQARKISSNAVKNSKFFVEVPVNASTLGSSAKMLIKGGLASAAIYGIVEAVGWVIEDGVVVKKNDPLGVPESIYIEAPTYGFDSTKTFTTKNAAVSAFLLKYLGHSNFTVGTHTLYSTVNLPNNKKKVIYTSAYKQGTENLETRVLVVVHGDVLPETVPISDTELGQAIIDSPSAPTVIPDVYDPNQATDTPARDASTTALDKAIPDSDTDVTTKPKPNKDTDGDGVPDVYDPELPDEGTITQIPAFCDWASTMCLWYERYIEDSTKLEEHQKEEKSFWEWFQKDDTSNFEEDSKVEDETQLPELSTNTFNFGGMCPSDINLPIPDPFGHTNNLTLSFETFCFWLTKLKPWVDVLGWIIAITILTGQRSANNEQ